MKLIFEFANTVIYISKTQRLEALDTLACTLMNVLLNHDFKSLLVKENDMKMLLNWVKGMQSVLKDIRKEMSTTDLELGKGHMYED